MEYKKTYVPQKGYTCLSKIGESSLQLIEFGIVELWEGDCLTFDTQDKETAFIILSGQASFRFDDQAGPQRLSAPGQAGGDIRPHALQSGGLRRTD